jgi:lysosomal alpha-mannosidase
VLLFGLPDQEHVGHEVTVNFYAPNIDNAGVFYTDSNGLEMQTRVINYRPTWDLTIKEGGLNVTANYYPVQTAIAIQDNNIQMVVMNDRS